MPTSVRLKVPDVTSARHLGRVMTVRRGDARLTLSPAEARELRALLTDELLAEADAMAAAIPLVHRLGFAVHPPASPPVVPPLESVW